MPSYKITYFNGRGRGELSRLVLTAAGQRFEDVRLAGPDWPALKGTTPWGGVPVLEVDGKMLAQSYTIARYLARQFSLAGRDDWEQALVESAVDATEDIFSGMASVMKTEESRKEQVIKTLREQTVPKVLAAFEKNINQNGKDGHVIGNKLTLADLALYNIVDQLLLHNHLTPEGLNQFPNTKAVVEKVKNQEKLAEYIKNRPVTPF